VVSPGALVLPVGGLLGFRVALVEIIQAEKTVRKRIENLTFMQIEFYEKDEWQK
jgi:hypothetical protein